MLRFHTRPASSLPARILPALVRLLVVALIPGMLSGCIVREIRDEMVVSNQSIADTNELLRSIREDINQTNAILDSLGQRLDRNMQQLEKLNSIDVSLTAIDAHLASLRGTLENIDSVIPFVSFADESEDEAATQPSTQPGTQPSTQPSTQPATRPTITVRPRPRPAATQPAETQPQPAPTPPSPPSP